jgi:hypothetical protein
VDAGRAAESLRDYPGLIPGILIAVVVGAVFAQPVARRFRIAPWNAFLFLVSAGLIVAATLTPGGEAWGPGSPGLLQGCDLSRLRPASLGQLRTLSDASTNVALFIPLGLAVGVLPRHRLRLLGAAVTLPVAIEAAQLVIGPLARACESADVIDNATGLVIGFVVGVFASEALHLNRGVAPQD